MKSVLISIRPEWCMKILGGEKTMEIRKTRPKLEPPFKCYIYCTKAPKKLITIFRDGDVFGDGAIYHGKPQFITWDGGNIPIEIRQKEQTVIAEFVCDKIVRLWIPDYSHKNQLGGYSKYIKESCVPYHVLTETFGNNYAHLWHISDLKVYDEPRTLQDFSRHGFQDLYGSGICGNEICKYYSPAGGWMEPPECELNGPCRFTRPPQSWCYVEEP